MLGRRDPGERGIVQAGAPAGSYDGRVRFEVLGPLRVVERVAAGGVPRPEQSLGGPKQRLVVALLLTEPNTTVSLERLIDGLWGDHPPDSARHTVQSYVSELRKVVGNVIERTGSGYAIRVGTDELDALDFEARVSAARAIVEDDPQAAVADLDAALGLWRGPPFEDHPDHPSLEAEAVRLDELRLAATELLLRARLALGHHAHVVAHLERLTREHPYREELRALQMLALYRSGRQADALRAFQATRAALAEELGVDPSPRLRRLEEQILLQDPDLDLVRADEPRTISDVRVENPYMGLRTFREADASRFYGHERLVDALERRVDDGMTFTAVVGPSGSGKSSAVHAGLLPRLRRRDLHLRIATMQPGSQPFAELEGALARTAGRLGPSMARLRESDDGLLDAVPSLLDPIASRLLIVVDQFEELFTLVEPDEAAAFMRAVLHAADDPRSRVQVLITLRADFYDRPLADPRLGARFVDNVVNVIPLGADELEAAAILPARQVDVSIEPRLVSRLIVDVTGQPNALPLFQYALTELFDERSGPVLDLATYERIGGVRKAVARRAESLYQNLNEPERAAGRQLFLRIATVSGDAIGRQRVAASVLAALDVDIVALQGAIDAFARYRLLVLDRDATTGAPTVELAHEALLAEWHRLRDWIDESRDDLAVHARFVVALNEWETAGRDPGYLLTGSRLDGYAAWASGTQMQLTAVERHFLDESTRSRDAEGAGDRERELLTRRLQRRTRWQLIALFVTVAVLAGIVAYPFLTADGPLDQVAIALDAPPGTDSFAALITEGLQRAAERQGLEARIVEPPYTDIVNVQGDLADHAELVLGTFLMWDSMAAAAAQHPDTTFVFLDSFDPPEIDNGVGVTFAQDEGSFLVGAAAALESHTGKVGYIGANASDLIEEFRAGFEQGAAAARPDIEIVTSILFPGPDEGGMGYRDEYYAQEVAEKMYREMGVDVIYTAAGGSGRGVIRAATSLSTELGRHLWAIGVDTDSVFELPSGEREHLLTSMVKRLDLVVERVVSEHVDGTLRVPSSLRLGLADGAVGYSTSGNHLRASTIDALQRLEHDITDGGLTVSRRPAAPPTLAADSPA